MKIAILSAATSIHTVKIVNALSSMGHTVRLYSLPNHSDTDKAISQEVEIIYLPHSGQKGYITNAFFLKKSLKAWNADVLNAHYASGYGFLGALSGFHPMLLSVWGSDIYDFPLKNFFCKWLIERNLKKADAIASTSYVMAEETKKYIKGNKAIYITPFGVDTEVFKPLPIAHDNIIIGFIKGISEAYGIRYLLQAFAICKTKSDLPIKLYVYGDGDQLNEMKQLAKSLNIENDTTFFGRIPHSEVSTALQGIDIFCVPSIHESFGVAAVEAMSCGIPVVTSDAVGLQEVMVNDETGYIVPRANEHAFAEKIAVLIADIDLREKLGTAGRERVLQLYDWNNNIKQLEEAIIKTAEIKPKSQ